MTKRFSASTLFLITLLFIAIPIHGQSDPSEPPASKIIDAKQLLLDLKTLSADDMEGRLAGSPGGIKARDYVQRRFKQSGLKSFGGSYVQPFEFSYPKKPNEKIKAANVVGYIRGKRTPEKYIVLTAHYDHLGIIKGETFNGADDNASGVASLFAIARYFIKHRPANSLIFVATDAEEGSGAGGDHFIKSSPVDRNALIMDVNVDAIGREKNDVLYAVGSFAQPYFRPHLENVARRSNIKVLFGHEDPEKDKGEDYWPPLQDGMSFFRNGIPYIYFGVEDNEQIHKPTDDYDSMTLPFYVRAVETVVDAVREFDKNLKQIEQSRAAK